MNNLSRDSRSALLGTTSTSSAKSIESTQWRKYHTRSGHGFAAEDANALHDRLRGRKVEMAGLSNELNGPDRIVDGCRIQSKYCASARQSVNAAFGDDGLYRYSGQRLEVPKDQYEKAIVLMEEKILSGKVPGVTNPQQASTIIKKGYVTYQEASNIGRTGNIDSIKFDVKTGMITCSFAAGLSFAIKYTSERRSGSSVGNAVREAAKDAAATSGKALGAHVVTQQFLRTQVGRNTAAAVTKGAKKAFDAVCQSKLGEKVVTRTVSGLTGAGKEMTERAAKVAGTKLLRTNVISSVAITVVSAVPDVVQACRGKKTWKDVFINSASNAAGTAGGATGAWIGAAIGSIIPGPGTAIGGFVGGIVGGVLASSSTREVLCRKPKPKLICE